MGLELVLEEILIMTKICAYKVSIFGLSSAAAIEAEVIYVCYIA